MATKRVSRSRGGSGNPISRPVYASRTGDDDVKWHWSLTILITGGLVGGFLTIYIYQFTLIPILLLIGAIAGVGFIGMLLQWKKFYSMDFIKKYYRIPVPIFAIYNFIGIGLLVTGLFLLTNWLGASSKEEIKRYKIVGLDRDYVVDFGGGAVVLLENKALDDQPQLRFFKYTEATKFNEKPVLEVIYHPGLLGFLILDDSRMSADTLSLKNQAN